MFFRFSRGLGVIGVLVEGFRVCMLIMFIFGGGDSRLSGGFLIVCL